MPVPRKIRVPLKDGDYAPDYETLRKTYWLHCRHTSVTYISRMVEMLEAFAKGFESYVAKRPEPGSLVHFVRGCFECLDEQKEGLARIRKADPTGFKLIRGAMNFGDVFYRDRHEWAFAPLGFHRDGSPGEALWAWIEKVMSMSLNIQGALGGRKSFPLFDISKFRFPDQIGGYPLANDVFIKDGEDIPVTGVWQPISLKGGCPNFLIQGEKAPKANLPILRIDTPAWDENMGGGSGIKHHEASSDFDLGQFSTVWQLVWEDDRWRDGKEPSGEDEYLLGPDTDPPKDPPIALRDSPP
jgi:hypothetical protein